MDGRLLYSENSISVDSDTNSDQGRTCNTPDQFSELRDMMQDLQVGFSTAMEELSKIQDEDQQLHRKLDTSKNKQDAQIGDILDVVQALKIRCDDIQYQIEVSNRNQKKLERQIKKLKSERYPLKGGSQLHKLSLDNLNSSYSHNDDGIYTSPMLKPFIASLPLPEEMGDVEYNNCSDSDESLVAVTQKSLSLTSELAQRAYSQPNIAAIDSDRSSLLSSKSGSHQAEYDKKVKTDSCSSTELHTAQRQKIVIKIVNSERDYCTTLYNILENYSTALKNCDGVTSRDFGRVFPNSLSKIYEYHCSVLKSLENRLNRWRQQDVLGDVFARFTSNKQMDIFAVYKDYITNFNSALKTIRKLSRSNERFRSVLKHCQTSSDRLSLVSQLLAPVERVPNYVLVIKKLLKYTDTDHPDRFFLETSLEGFRTALLSMNEVIEQTINLTKSNSNSSEKISVETESWSSHEEDQRLSTATKDSGIHSNCELDSEELSHPAYSQAPHNLTKRLYHIDDSDSSLYKELPPRPRSVIDFNRLEDFHSYHSLPRRCKTPTSMPSSKKNSIGYRVSSLKMAKMSVSSPDLLEEYEELSAPPKVKTKHKVQFKNPPEEHLSKRVKKRSITDTLRIFFNKRKNAKNNNCDIAESCEFATTCDEVPKPAPPEMFANDSTECVSYGDDVNVSEETLEDENGDPYSLV